MKYKFREIILLAAVIISFTALMLLDPISQDLSYHDLADKRTIFAIPNFFDVTTNILFAIFGYTGLLYAIRHKQPYAHLPWIVFFSGVALVSLGSGYYHLDPNNETLVWDRLPMTLGFMGLFVALLSEYVNPNFEKYLLLPFVLLGLFSVVYWHYTDDLRVYIWVQLIPLLIIPIVLMLFKGKYTLQLYLLYALILYLLAKTAEQFDREIFSITSEQLSGHSLKHILAAFAPLVIYLMIKNRYPLKAQEKLDERNNNKSIQV